MRALETSVLLARLGLDVGGKYSADRAAGTRVDGGKGRGQKSRGRRRPGGRSES